MRVVLRTLFGICICLFLAKDISVLGTTIVGDILIETQKNGLLYCDSLICPKGTAQCQVTKRNDPIDFKTIVRTRKCIGPNGAILQEQTLNEPNKYLSIVNVNVASGGGIYNRPLTPEEKKELDETLKEVQQNIQTELKPFLDGSFEKNLQKEILNSFKI